MIVLTYGGGATGTVETYFQARIGTPELGFPDPGPGLVRLLRRQGLFLEEAVDPGCWRRYEAKWDRCQLLAERVCRASQVPRTPLME